MPSGGLWCKVAVTLPRHIKTERLAADLGIPIPEAVGRLVMMWIYAVEMSPSGLLTEDDIQRSFCLNSDLSVSMAVQALTAPCTRCTTGEIILACMTADLVRDEKKLEEKKKTKDLRQRPSPPTRTRASARL